MPYKKNLCTMYPHKFTKLHPPKCRRSSMDLASPPLISATTQERSDWVVEHPQMQGQQLSPMQIAHKQTQQ